MLSESLSDRFLNAADPVVLLNMPGCEPLVVNRAHEHYFGNEGWDYRRERYERLVTAEAGHAAGETCYCERVSAILALREHDCVFERAFQQLRNHRSEVFSGIEFHLVSQDPLSGDRLYSVSRVHARSRGGSLLEIRIVPLPELTVEISNVGNRLPPTLCSCVVRFDRTVWFRHAEKLDRAPEAYAAVDAALDQCRGSPSIDDARSDILSSFRAVKETHVPPSHLLKHLFREPRLRFVSEDDIRMLRERLCDARILRARLAQLIERRLADHRTLLKTSVNASPEKLVRLLRCSLQLASLESAEAMALPDFSSPIIYRPESEGQVTCRAAEPRLSGGVTGRHTSNASVSAFDRLAEEPDHQLRGFGLQKLLDQVFSCAEIPWKKSFTRNDGGEQIDGAFSFQGWFYIVECRWRARAADISQIDGLLGQVGRSGRQCMGLFLSIEGWSDNVPRLLRQNPQKSILLMDGSDLRAVVEGRIALSELIVRKLAHLNMHGEPFLGVAAIMPERRF